MVLQRSGERDIFKLLKMITNLHVHLKSLRKTKANSHDENKELLKKLNYSDSRR